MKEMSTNELLVRVEHTRAQLEALQSGRMKTRQVVGTTVVDSTMETIAEVRRSLQIYNAMLVDRLPAPKMQ